MKVVLKILPDRILEVDLPRASTPAEARVEDLQEAIARVKPEASVDRQRLVYRGRVMRTGQTLADCNWVEGNQIHLLIRRRDQGSEAKQQQPQQQQRTSSDQSDLPAGVNLPNVEGIMGHVVPVEDPTGRGATPIMTTLPAFPAHVSSAPEYPLQEFSQTTASVENLQEQLEAIAGASEIPASPVPFDEIVEVQRYPPMTLYGVGGILKNISEVMEGLTQATGRMETFLKRIGQPSDAPPPEGQLPFDQANRLAGFMDLTADNLKAVARSLRGLHRARRIYNPESPANVSGSGPSALSPADIMSLVQSAGIDPLTVQALESPDHTYTFTTSVIARLPSGRSQGAQEPSSADDDEPPMSPRSAAPAPAAPAQQQSRQQGRTAPAQQLDVGSLMQSLMGQLNNPSSGSGSQSITEFMQSALGDSFRSGNDALLSDDDGDDAEESEARVEDDDDDTAGLSGSELIAACCQDLTIPEMAMLSGGRASPSVFEKMRQGLQATFLEHSTVGDTPEFRRQLVETYVALFLDSTLLGPSAQEIVGPEITPGAEIAPVVRPLARDYFTRIVEGVFRSPEDHAALVRQAEIQTEEPPVPWNELVMEFVGAWTHSVIPFYRNGLESAMKHLELFTGALSAAVDSPMIPTAMVLPLMETIYRKKYHEYLDSLGQEDQSGQPRWMRAIPEAERAEWLETMEKDEQRQAELLEQAQIREDKERAMFRATGLPAEEEEAMREAEEEKTTTTESAAASDDSLNSVMANMRSHIRGTQEERGSSAEKASGEGRAAPQRPFSHGYREGSSGQKRPVLSIAPETSAAGPQDSPSAAAPHGEDGPELEESFYGTLKSSVEEVEAAEERQQPKPAQSADRGPSAEAAVEAARDSPFGDRYVDQLAWDVFKKLRADPNYDSSRIESLAAAFFGSDL